MPLNIRLNNIKKCTEICPVFKFWEIFSTYEGELSLSENVIRNVKHFEISIEDYCIYHIKTLVKNKLWVLIKEFLYDIYNSPLWKFQSVLHFL